MHTCRCQALDEIGDESTIEDRQKYFDEVDSDHLDGVDFEEFLEVLYTYSTRHCYSP